MEKKSKIKISFNAPVILSFVAICFVVLLINYITGGTSNRRFFVTYHSSLASPLTYIRFFTHVLGHADWSHYIGNMSYILLLGPMLEEKHGKTQIIEVICITALVTALINYMFFWNIGICGASGVVFAFILMASFTSFREGEIPLTVILVAVIYIGQQIFDGIFVQDNISNMAHIFGGVTGAVLGYMMNRKAKGKSNV